MPEIIIYLVEGRTVEQKHAAMREITDAVVRNLNAPVQAVTIQIVECPRTDKAKGGVPFSER